MPSWVIYVGIGGVALWWLQKQQAASGPQTKISQDRTLGPAAGDSIVAQPPPTSTLPTITVPALEPPPAAAPPPSPILAPVRPAPAPAPYVPPPPAYVAPPPAPPPPIPPPPKPVNTDVLRPGEPVLIARPDFIAAGFAPTSLFRPIGIKMTYPPATLPPDTAPPPALVKPTAAGTTGGRFGW